MRLALEICGHVLTLTWETAGTDAPSEPVAQGSQCGLLETAGDPGEDVRMPPKTYMPLGFTPNPWRAPRIGGYQGKDSGRPKPAPPTGPGPVGRRSTR